MTLLLSYLIFTKPLTEQHGTGLTLISMGIILKMVPDYKPPNGSRGARTVKVSYNEENRMTERNREEDGESRALV